ALAKQKAIKKEAEEKEKLKAKEIPIGDYPDFSNSRLLDMGLSQEDANTFVHELIGQVDDHIPQIEAAIVSEDYEQIERLTHSIKGSATNLGTGGIADVMVDFNTYCKSGTDERVIMAHLNNLKAYQEKLKSQFL
ncbi:MAG: Hpt domain-containing protein, partial [Campylobacterota bacterium]|nr:Hpt domain-containing protein [Campylobacterota bacterium]